MRTHFLFHRTSAVFIALWLATHFASGAGWERVAGKKDEAWFCSEEGHRVIAQVIAYQYPSGGWPKNLDMTLPNSLEGIKKKIAGEDMSTIDNGTTYTQIHFLSKAYTFTHDESAKAAALKGLDYLFVSQYSTGGWPVYYPHSGEYYGVVHYNDNSVVGALWLMKAIVDEAPEFSWLPSAYRAKAGHSLKLGIECILNSQVETDGFLTVWCAQHDPVTLEPAAARTFEPVSLSGMESAYLVEFLMELNSDDERIVKAIDSAVAWFEKTRIDDVDLRMMPDTNGVMDRCLVHEAGAGPLWARFYEIGTNRPIFAGRDRVIHYDYDRIERERRTGYKYFSDAPLSMLSHYQTWKATHSK